MSQIELLARQLARERRARLEAEQLLEAKSLQLFTANHALESFNEALEEKVRARTVELSHARDAALASAKAKDEFLANMSHEIRTPLNGILGMLHALAQTPLTPRQQSLLTTANGSGKILLQVINDLLDFAKFENIGVHITDAPLNVRELLQGVVASFAETAQNKKLKLHLHIDEDVPTALVADGFRLQQILFNLLSNALKFTAAGSVTLECTRMLPEQVRFAVRDTGIGIADDKKHTIFAAFEQADASISRQYGGTGLGLAICNRIAQAMASQMQVADNPAGGSVFFFDLAAVAWCPLTAPALPTQQPAAHNCNDRDMAKLRVLVVDDNAINLEVACELISLVNATATRCSNGQAAIQAVQSHPFDLVFMDLQMPQMDGIAATRAIRALGGRFAALPIIAMTANALVHEREQCFAAGMNGFISKPIDPDLLFAVMREQASVALAEPAPALRPASNDAWAALCYLEGIELNEATKRFRGDTTLYLTLLRRFADDYRDTSVTLLQEMSPAALEALCHKLKGTGANLGALRTAKIAAEIEHNLKHGHPLPPAATLLELVNALAQVSRSACLAPPVAANAVAANAVAAKAPSAHTGDAASREQLLGQLNALQQCLPNDLGRTSELIAALNTSAVPDEFRQAQQAMVAAFAELRLADLQTTLQTTLQQLRNQTHSTSASPAITGPSIRH